MLIVVKIGTEAVLSNMSKIVSEITAIKQTGAGVVLVSSGAVGFGKSLCEKIEEMKILASVGQVDLMQRYKDEFAKFNIVPSQILISKTDIEKNGGDIMDLIRNISFRQDVVPIINENDSISFRSSFADNDELAGIISKKIKTDKLILLTNVDGLYDNYGLENQSIISDGNLFDLSKIDIAKSDCGRGGMISKVRTAQMLSKYGIKVVICNVNAENVLFRIINDEKIGTTFN